MRNGPQIGCVEPGEISLNRAHQSAQILETRCESVGERKYDVVVAPGPECIGMGRDVGYLAGAFRCRPASKPAAGIQRSDQIAWRMAFPTVAGALN